MYRPSSSPAALVPAWTVDDHFRPSQIAGLSLWLRPDVDVLSDGAAQFTAASSHYLDVADTAALSAGDIDFCLAGWLKLTTGGANKCFVSKAAGSGAANVEYSLLYASAANRLGFIVSNGSTTTQVNWSSAPSNGVWYFVVAWHDAAANTINIQVNDAAAVSAAHTTGCYDSTHPFQIGRRGASLEHLDGAVDSLGFWKRTLTALEKTWLYNAGVGRTYAAIGQLGNDGSNLKTNLQAWWNLAEATGTRSDSHGANHLTDHNNVAPAVGVVAGMAGDEDTVSLWKDASTAARNAAQGNAAKRPTLELGGARPLIVLDGSDDEWTLASALAANLTALWVSSPAGGTGLGSPMSNGGTDFIDQASSTTLVVSGDAGGAGGTFTHAAQSSTGIHVVRGHPSFGHWLGGVPSSFAGTNVSDMTVDRLGNGDNRFSGSLGDVLLYDRVLTNAQLNKLGKYLAKRYGLPWTAI
jgi:hypothetical protein